MQVSQAVLNESLEEEKQADASMTRTATSEINHDAVAAQMIPAVGRQTPALGPCRRGSSKGPAPTPRKVIDRRW